MVKNDLDGSGSIELNKVTYADFSRYSILTNTIVICCSLVYAIREKSDSDQHCLFVYALSCLLLNENGNNSLIGRCCNSPCQWNRIWISGPNSEINCRQTPHGLISPLGE